MIGYLRVSTDKQELSVGAQRAAIEAYIARRGLEPVRAWYTDEDVHGNDPLDKRPGLQAALGDLSHGEDIVVLRRDRLARDVVIATTVDRLLAKQGSRVVTTDGAADLVGPEGVLMRGITDLIAEYERLLISARTKAALGRKRLLGQHTGGQPPMGYRVSRKPINRKAGERRLLEPDPHEQGLVELAVSVRSGGGSYRDVGRALEANGYQPREGKWYPTTIRRLLIKAGATNA